jgi:hypothetical protein
MDDSVRRKGECMADTAQSLPIETTTLESLGPNTLTALAGYYTSLNPGKDMNVFVQEILNPMGSHSTGAAYLEEFKRIQSTDSSVDLRYGPMMISCAYCLEAMRYLAGSKREIAWNRMSAARYWCGVTLASQGISAAREQTIKATRKHAGKNAAKAGAEINYGKTKEEAYRLVREKVPPGKGWQSRRQAMLVIKKEVIEFSATQKRKLSSNQAEKTIYDWLAGMPDAAMLFPARAQSKAR